MLEVPPRSAIERNFPCGVVSWYLKHCQSGSCRAVALCNVANVVRVVALCNIAKVARAVALCNIAKVVYVVAVYNETLPKWFVSWRCATLPKWLGHVAAKLRLHMLRGACHVVRVTERLACAAFTHAPERYCGQ
jgi:hypothetical protein